MRLTILALGSRGDVQPFVALGRGLAAAGVSVTIAAAGDYGPLVREHGLAFHQLVGLISELADPAAIDGMLAVAANPLLLARRFLAEAGPLVERLLADCLAAAHPATGPRADALLVSTLGMHPGFSLAEALGIPCVVAHMHPYGPTASAPQMFFPPPPAWLPGAGAYNRLTHLLGDQAQWQLLRGPLNRARRRVLDMPELGPLKLRRWLNAIDAPTVFAYSAHVAPPPPDWPAPPAITGYWFLDRPADWQPPAEVAAFLRAGPPPVYIGFGSMMPGPDGDRITAIAAEALARAGRRGLLARGWGDLARQPLPDHLLAVDALPHDWLFPQLAAVVHHGGAGVTAAALRAGIPALAVPFLGDQRFWGRRVRELGAGPPPLPRAELAVGPLAGRIAAAAGSAGMRQRAAAIGRQLRAERGVARAVETILALCGQESTR